MSLERKTLRVEAPDPSEIYTARQKLLSQPEEMSYRISNKGETTIPLSRTTFRGGNLLYEWAELGIGFDPNSPKYGIRGRIFTFDSSQDEWEERIPNLAEIMQKDGGEGEKLEATHNPRWNEPGKAIMSVSDTTRFLQYGIVSIQEDEVDLTLKGEDDYPYSFLIDAEERFRRRIRSFANIYGVLIRALHTEAGIPAPNMTITLKPQLDR